LTVPVRRAALAVALAAGLACLAPREGEVSPFFSIMADGRPEARHSTSATVVDTEPRAASEARRGAGREEPLRNGDAASRRERSAAGAKAPKPVTHAPSARSADPGGAVSREITAAERTYAHAMAHFIAARDFADASAPLARLYFATFGRFPDQEGLEYYVAQRAQGRSLDAIADEFLGSREFDMRYGAIDNARFVDRVFTNVFGSAPDAVQRDYWLAALDSGMTRAQLMLTFSEGAEFRYLSANEVFVAMAYAEALGRTPDDAGFAYWVRFLDAGNPREAVIEGLVATNVPRNSGRNPPRGG
jgi:hypothetical protein